MSTARGFLTNLALHPKWGKQALENIGIWPRFHGCRSGIGGRVTTSMSVRIVYAERTCCAIVPNVHEQEQQGWAGQMHDLLLHMQVAAAWRDVCSRL